jgi:uncharacterized membrane protein YkvA (DUF1232 family)
MGEQVNPNANPGSLVQVVRTLRLVWRLVNDPRVPILSKLIVPAAIIYVVWPLDLIPDAIPFLGQLDDVGVVVLGIRFFIQACPAEIVMEHRRAIAGVAAPGSEDYVDATYRVVDDEEKR